ncbi:MAG: hypothetical protein IBX68_09585 [Dehalococcoidia bacterium]|nr:hypothetical protein [Dehalococcoidia bacterium]
MEHRETIRSFINGAISEQKARKAEIEASFQERIKDLGANIAALERTLALFDASNGGGEQGKKFSVAPEAIRANAKTHREALRFIGEHTGGTIHYTEARDLLIASGLTKGQTSNVASQVYRLLSKSPEWEKVSEGRFRLVKSRV